MSERDLTITGPKAKAFRDAVMRWDRAWHDVVDAVNSELAVPSDYDRAKESFSKAEDALHHVAYLAEKSDPTPHAITEVVLKNISYSCSCGASDMSLKTAEDHLATVHGD